MFTKVENSVKSLPKEEADNLRAKVSLALQSAELLKDNLTWKERTAIKNRCDDESITILPADRGRATVILYKVDYLEKCLEHINNRPYKYLKHDHTESIKRKARKKLQSLKDREIIDQCLYFKLKPTPKIHRTGTPIRPIVSYTGTPFHCITYPNT